VSGLDVGHFEKVLKTGNKSGNSILKAFSDSGLDVKKEKFVYGNQL